MGNDTLRKFRGVTMSGSQTNIPAEEAYEKCISCKKQTAVCRDTPVDKREHYIRSCGQLCPECYKQMMKSDRAGNTISNEEMQYLVETLRCPDK